MFRFLKDNSYTAVKMLINQIGITFFGLILSMAATILGGDEVLVAVSVFSILFYLFLLYTMTNEIGQKDKIRVEAGRAKPNTLNYAFLALIANSINIILGIIAVIGKLFISNIGFFESIPQKDFIASPEWAGGMYAIASMIAQFTQAMYLGVISVLFDGNPLIFLIIPIPAIITSTLGYYIGVKRGTFGPFKKIPQGNNQAKNK